MKRTLLSLAAASALLLAACGSTTGSSSGSTGGQPAAKATPACSPAPCATKDGVTVTVSNLNRNVPPAQFEQLPANTHIVSLMVGFQNEASQEYNANPFNFVLKDSTGVKHQLAFTMAAGCTSWQPVNLTRGAALAPQPLCFQANGDPNAPLTLVWTPTMFQGDQNIPLQ